MIRFRVRNEMKVGIHERQQRIAVEYLDKVTQAWVAKVNPHYAPRLEDAVKAAFETLMHREIDQDLVTAAAAKLLCELGRRWPEETFEVSWGYTPPPPPVVFEDPADQERITREVRAATGVPTDQPVLTPAEQEAIKP